MIAPGTYTLGPPQGTMLVHTYREGMARKVGHDLVIEATRWSATVNVDGEDLTRSSGTVTIDARSFQVRSGTGGAKALSDKDSRDIENNIDDKVLKTGQHPEITFRSTRVEAHGGDAIVVHGDLTVVGNTRPARLDVTLPPGGAGNATGVMTVVQSEWGIKPFSALMGTLKVRDAIEITIEAPVPAG